MAAECGMGPIGLVALVEHDANGPVDCRPLIQTDKSRSRGGRRKVGIQHDQPIPVAETRSMLTVTVGLVTTVVPVTVGLVTTVVPVAVSLVTTVVPVAVSLVTTVVPVAVSVVGGPGRSTGGGDRCVEGVSEVGGKVDERAGRCCVEDDLALVVEPRA